MYIYCFLYQLQKVRILDPINKLFFKRYFLIFNRYGSRNLKNYLFFYIDKKRYIRLCELQSRIYQVTLLYQMGTLGANVYNLYDNPPHLDDEILDFHACSVCSTCILKKLFNLIKIFFKHIFVNLQLSKYLSTITFI